MVVPEEALEALKKKLALSDEEAEGVEKYLSSLHKGDVVRPGEIKHITHKDFGTIYEALMELEKQGLIHIIYRYYCTQCSSWQTEIWQTIGSIPCDDVKCAFCKRPLSFSTDSYVLFQVN
jgi:hypothetical protein